MHAFSLTKKFLQTYLFDKYPEIGEELKDDAFYNYRKFVMDKLVKLRHEHLDEVNKNATYKVISVVDREKTMLKIDDCLESQVGQAKRFKNDLNLML